jgi:hypothetical protein
VIRLTLRTWARYLAPLAVLSVVALAPALYLAHAAPLPVDVEHARALCRLGWIIAAVAWIPQLVLVGGAAPAARGIVARAPISQLHALGGGAIQLVRAIVPCLAAAFAIVLGGVALLVPGVILFALLALTGASDARGMPGPLADSVASARGQLIAVATAAFAMLAADLAIPTVLWIVERGMPLSHRSTPDELAVARWFLRATVVGIAAVSALPATALALLHARRYTGGR